ncbi:hypothetical protein AB0H83_44515 [Dactylosporangium sp. NPDC050688]|uniref:hypothetical protein n=1 Tax=Dactylosporangium sp. NPDC050688 TaxID=3157217 RepID=UPI0034101EAB
MESVNAPGQRRPAGMHFGCGRSSAAVKDKQGDPLVADLWFVLLTIAAFAVLGLAVRAVERL